MNTILSESFMPCGDQKSIYRPFQNILSIKSFFLFPYAKTYYFYDICVIIMMTTRVHFCKQVTLNA